MGKSDGHEMLVLSSDARNLLAPAEKWLSSA